MIHRAFNLFDSPIEIKNVGLPMLEKDIDEKLKKLLVQLPLLQYGDVFYKSTEEILDFVSMRTPKEDIPFLSEFKLSLLNRDSFYTWGNETFLQSLLYARWIDGHNYPRFVHSVDWGVEDNVDLEIALVNTRKEVLRYMKKTPVGSLTAKQFEVHLFKQLDKLNSFLEKRPYFGDSENAPIITDLAVFMVIQGLLAPQIAQREIILQKYPQIIRWAVAVDKITSLEGNQTIIL